MHSRLGIFRSLKEEAGVCGGICPLLTKPEIGKSISKLIRLIWRMEHTETWASDTGKKH